MAVVLLKIIEEAHFSGELKLSGRKLKDFPKAAAKYNLSDTVIAGSLKIHTQIYLYTYLSSCLFDFMRDTKYHMRRVCIFRLLPIKCNIRISLAVAILSSSSSSRWQLPPIWKLTNNENCTKKTNLYEIRNLSLSAVWIIKSK